MSAQRKVMVTEEVITHFSVQGYSANGPTLGKLRQFVKDADAAGFTDESRCTVRAGEERGESGFLELRKSTITVSEIQHD